MKVQVIPNAGEARADQFAGKTTIVIDVLRATSTIVTALAKGAAGVVPVETVMEAKTRCQPGDLLGGERFCRKITGFDFGNSPLELDSGAVSGRRLLLTTTNGTRAIQKAARSEQVLAGSLLNASRCAAAAAALRRDIVLFCAGTHDVFALEDSLCAGLLIDRLIAHADQSVEADDLGTVLHGYYLQAAHHIADVMQHCASAKRLHKIGHGDDVAFCAQVDQFDAVPRLTGDMMTIG